MTLYHVTKCSIYLSITVHYKLNYSEIGRFTAILSITVVLSCFYLLISRFENLSTRISRLPFAVNAILILISLILIITDLERNFICYKK